MIYLDHASTTPLCEEAAEAMARTQADAFANPSSLHAAGRRAKQSLEDSRERILELLGGTASGRLRDRLVFTSGATEANRLGILGMASAIASLSPPALGSPGTIFVSARDHASIHAAAAAAGDHGFLVRSLPLSSEGIPDRGALAEQDAAGAAAIATATVVCGQTGIIDDPGQIALDLPGVLLHADAAQSAAWLGRPFRELSAATMAVAPHKFGGPRGIGCLVIRQGERVEPVVPGPQESGLRGGTEPVVLAAGFAAALEATERSWQAEAARIAGIRQDFERRLVSAALQCGMNAVVIGGDRPRSPHISTISFPGLDRQAIVMAADIEGIACSTGTACSSGSSEPSPAIVSMALPGEIVRGSVRFSFGARSTHDEIDRCVPRLTAVLRRIAGIHASPSALGDRNS